MPARSYTLLPILARGREAVEQAYESIVALAKKGKVPCSALEAYRSVRERQLRLESLAVEEAKAGGVHPPEWVPRYFPVFGACPARVEEIEVGPEARLAAFEHVRQRKMRERATDVVFSKAYKENPHFKQYADRLLLHLQRYAREGTAETKPAPGNIALLRLYYFLGGHPWNVREADKLQQVVFQKVSDQAALRVLHESLALDDAVARLAKARGTPLAGAEESEEKRTPTWLLVGGAVVGAGVLGFAGWVVYRRLRGDRSLSASSEIGYDDEYEEAA